MDKESPPPQAFLLRFWLEGSGEGDHEWRGRAYDVGGGEVIYFRNWRVLCGFLRDRLGAALSAESRDQIRRRPMPVEKTREVMNRYFNSEHGDLSMMADDVVFTVMATGQEHRGPQAVQDMLQYFYHIAFEARVETRNEVYAEGQAALEWDFVGTHIGEFAGIPATGKPVNVPLCVVYDLENNQIKRGRVYFEMPALLQQLGAGG